MPFYLATPRPTTISGRMQSGTYAKSDYIRSQPSGILYQLASGYMHPLAATTYSMLGFIASAISSFIKGTPSDYEEFNYEHTPFFFAPFKVTNCPELQLPEVHIQIVGRPRDQDIQIIAEKGGEIRKIKGATKDTWVVRPSTLEDLSELANIDSLDITTKPTENSMVVSQTTALVLLYTRIFYIANLLSLLSPQSPVSITYTLNTLAVSNPEGKEPKGETNPSDEEDDEPATGMQVEEHGEEVLNSGGQPMQTATVNFGSKTSITSISIHNLPAFENHRTFGRVEDCPTHHGGIFVPFERNYAQHDLPIGAQFVETFRSLFFEDSTEYDEHSHEILQDWARGLYQTDLGDYLAHMMKSLMMAKEAGCGIYLIINEDGHYQGSVLLGDSMRVRLVGREWVEAVDKDTLENELQVCNSHAAAVQRILDRAGLVASNPQQFKTLRSLSQAVNASGEPSGMVKNLIMKELPNLSFNERYESVNLDTLIDTFHHLTTSAPIPSEMHMDPGFFFPKDRYEEVLCRFGSSAPSFNYGGGSEVRCCSIAAPRIAKLAWNADTPPSTLQVQRIRVGSAATQWADMIENGHINGIFNRRLTGTRIFVGEEKNALWKRIDEFCRVGSKFAKVQTSAIAGDGVVGGGKKRDREDDMVKVDRKLKLAKFF